ncbi:hypothetical protein [Achromobacter sp. K91]|uniref:hypothetical protein n=1 Tax=Achromobacter sp. K91 TaxID=2292262 RepID=UPI001314F340|nr:hypothetical protein [Achromobacter sp. K91]
MSPTEETRPPQGERGEAQTVRTPRGKRGPWQLLAFWAFVVAILFLVGVVSRWLQ